MKCKKKRNNGPPTPELNTYTNLKSYKRHPKTINNYLHVRL